MILTFLENLREDGGKGRHGWDLWYQVSAGQWMSLFPFIMGIKPMVSRILTTHSKKFRKVKDVLSARQLCYCTRPGLRNNPDLMEAHDSISWKLELWNMVIEQVKELDDELDEISEEESGIIARSQASDWRVSYWWRGVTVFQNMNWKSTKSRTFF